jgi:oligoendopeptidase F
MTTSTVQGTLPARSDVPVALTWDLSMIFATDEAWDNTFAAAEALITKLPEFKGKLKRSGKQLHAFLSLRDRIGEDLDKLYVYASMKADQDTANTANQEREEKIRGLLTKYSAAVSWSTPELLSLKPERLETFLAKTPALKLWKQQLDELDRERPHVRNPEVEELLAQYSQVSQGPSNTFSMLDNADLKLPMIKNEEGVEVQLTHGNYIVFLQSRNPEVRKAAYLGMMSAFDGMRNTIAANYAAKVKGNIFEARARKYPSALAAALGPDNVPLSVYKNLVATAHEYLPVLRRYLDLRKKELLQRNELIDGKLHMWDLYVPIVGSTSTIKSTTRPPRSRFSRRWHRSAPSMSRLWMAVWLALGRRASRTRASAPAPTAGGCLTAPAVHADELAGQPGAHVHPGSRSWALHALLLHAQELSPTSTATTPSSSPRWLPPATKRCWRIHAVGGDRERSVPSAT